MQAKEQAHIHGLIHILQLKELVGESLAHTYYPGLIKTFLKYDINTLLRQAHFLGQTMHESNSFKTIQENLNYKASALTKIFSFYAKNPELAQEHGRTSDHKANQRAIANHAYANRGGNGSPQTCDGWNYRGAGLIQITLADNYNRCGRDIGVSDLTADKVINDPKLTIMTSGWYWGSNAINTPADKDDIEAVTKKINPPLKGIDDRIAKTKRAIEVLS